jgi:predicted ATPase
MRSKSIPGKCRRIVLTGGPGGGKTTAADLFRREIGDRVVIVPEAATILFQGGFPRSREPRPLRITQTAIYQVQRYLEDVQASLYPERTLLCDRGTVDGAAYWPGEGREYFKSVGTTLKAELDRYDAVIFFETAAVGGASIEGGNPIRDESLEEAVRLDLKLRALWSQHPRFTMVPHNPSFFKKIGFGLAALDGIFRQCNGIAPGMELRAVPGGPPAPKRRSRR